MTEAEDDVLREFIAAEKDALEQAERYSGWTKEDRELRQYWRDKARAYTRAIRAIA